MKIDEAYVDPRFNKEIDKKNNYRTKTILAMPIKDFAGGVIGILYSLLGKKIKFPFSINRSITSNK